MSPEDGRIAAGDAISGSDRGVAAETRRPAITRLDLTQFRNYREIRVEAVPGVVVLTGPNGAGKTNLLEAISFLSPGRGLRRARLGEIDRRDPVAPGSALSWAVAAQIADGRETVGIGTGRETSAGNADRRTVRIDGQPARGQVALSRYLSLVWLTPQMDRLFQEGAAPRRRFLDRLVFGFQPDHAGRLASYEAALRERGKLLKERSGDAAWFRHLERRLAEDGVAIAEARLDVTRRLDLAARDPETISFPAARIAIEGDVEDWLAAGMSAADAADRLAAALQQSRRRDAESGSTATGPHRSDLAVIHAAKGMTAPQCSTGEQKALLISLVLAHAALLGEMAGRLPVLLLDEATAHLDRARRSALFDRIASLGGQAWLTGTETQSFAELGSRAHFMYVDDGRIEPV